MAVAVGHPILLASGAQFNSELDYETQDGLFSIGRYYRSFQVGLPLDGFALPISTPRWLTGGWNFNFGYEIQLETFSGSPSSPSAKVGILTPDGTGYAFVLQSDGQWIADPAGGAARAQPDLKLAFVGTLPADLSTLNTTASNWKLTDSDDTVWNLRTAAKPNSSSYDWGWPTSRTTRDGYAWTFAYNNDSSLASITDSFGRAATFTWAKFYISSLASPPAGSMPFPIAVSSIALPDGTSLRYTYDPPAATAAPSTAMIQRLVKVERLSAASAILNAETYLYEDTRFPTHVTGIVNNLGNRVETYAYDGEGRTISNAGANGTNAYAVTYGVNGTAITRRATNPNGKASTYTYSSYAAGPNDYRLTQVAGEASPNTPANTSSAAYGSDTLVSGNTDEEGRTTTVTRDTRGNPTTIVEASGNAAQRTTTMTWHPTLNVPATTVRTGLTEARGYYANGQLNTVTLTDTTAQSVPYATNGQTRTWTYTWNTAGRLLTINGPLAADGQGHDDITTFAYDPQGNTLLTMTNALGQVTSYAGYDANGRPGTVTDPNGIVTAYTYDGMGRVKTITVKHPTTASLDAVTTLTYDAIGQVTGITLPSTDQLIMDYDAAGRVTSMRGANGERRDYGYDAMGNVTSETVKRTDATVSQQITRTFDELGRMISEALGQQRPSRWGYDKVGNATLLTSANGYATTQAFDALNRVATTVAPDSGNTVQGYDVRDNVTSFQDPKSVTTSYVRNGFGDTIQETSPDRGTTTYWYDAAGRMTQSKDGRNQIVTYTRDYLGRVTSKVPTGLSAQAVTFTWDTGGLSGSYGVGRVGKIVDGSGTTTFKYDHRGNMLVQQQVVGTSTAAQLVYAYDLGDRVAQVTYPSGRIVQYLRDSKGRVSTVQTKASSSVTSWTSVASGLTYEPFGAVKAMTLGNTLSVANSWGTDGRLASRRLYRTSGGANLSYLGYGYDGNGNLSSIVDQVTAANSVWYGYDGNDRLTLTALGSGTSSGTDTYSYTTGTNRLSQVANSVNGTRSLNYDNRGNLTSESRPGSISATTSYDGYARLTGYVRTDVGTLSFVYNGRDDRVAKTSGAGTRRFVYDPDGRVIGEYGTSVADVKAEFVWALPQVANDTTPFGGDDGAGGYMPLAVATPDSTGTIVLNWVHGNHIGVPIATTDASGNAATTPNDYLAPGFPGQSRTIADLYYNRYRDYDPATGRYIQADPIGIDGGPNSYVYAANNPIRFTDPMGLDWTHVTGRTIECGRGCTIRIDYTVQDGKKVRHLHWDCKGNQGTCGENGAESHGEGRWEDAPQFVKDCAKRHGFNGEDSPADSPKARLPLPPKTPWWVPLLGIIPRAIPVIAAF